MYHDAVGRVLHQQPIALLALSQLLALGSTLADVPADQNRALRSRGREVRRNRRLVPHHRPGGRRTTEHDSCWLVALHSGLERELDFVSILGVHAVEHSPAEDCVSRRPHDPIEVRTGVGDAALRIDLDDQIIAQLTKDAMSLLVIGWRPDQRIC